MLKLIIALIASFIGFWIGFFYCALFKVARREEIEAQCEEKVSRLEQIRCDEMLERQRRELLEGTK